MHAIWLSIFVPLLVAAVWIWPKVRLPKLWFGLFLLTSLATVIWVGNDLLHFLQVKGTWGQSGLRTLYLLLSEPDKPALQLIIGFLLAALFSRLLNKPSAVEIHPPVQTGK